MSYYLSIGAKIAFLPFFFYIQPPNYQTNMANARAIEPVEVASGRKQQHREHMANASTIEPVEVATQRKQKNREHKL